MLLHQQRPASDRFFVVRPPGPADARGEQRRRGHRMLRVLLREQDPGYWRISLRSTDLDVGEISRRLGGGGHRLAAGCELNGSRAEVAARMLAEVAGARRGGQ